LKIAVIGGGITGLSAAYYVLKKARELQVPVELTLIEQSGRLGGKINTLHRDGFVIERGPDSFLSRKPAILELVRDLGLERELTGTNPQATANYIVRHGRLHLMPRGLALGIPTEIGPFVRTGLLSPIGKLRAGLDLLLPRRKADRDESLGRFIERRLGKQMLTQIAEPLLAGIYAGDTASLSLRATFPQFHEMESRYRSLIIGTIAGKRRPAPVKSTSAPGPGTSAVIPQSLFLTFKQGLNTLVDQLSEELIGHRILTGQPVKLIFKTPYGYVIALDHMEPLQVDGIVLATPAGAAAQLLPGMSTTSKLEQIPYASVANVVLAYDRPDVPHPLDGSGFLVPRTEGRSMTACTWTSSKWLHTSPPNKVLLRVYIGRSGSQEHVKWTDQDLLSAARHDLQYLMGIEAPPLFGEITRLPRSMPQYPVGHLEQLKLIRAEMDVRYPGVFLCGAGYEGVGIPDCVRQGKEAAERLVGELASRQET
jgi:oxygen-dependent protoporphyrinogen oxidase